MFSVPVPVKPPKIGFPIKLAVEVTAVNGFVYLAPVSNIFSEARRTGATFVALPISATFAKPPMPPEPIESTVEMSDATPTGSFAKACLNASVLP